MGIYTQSAPAASKSTVEEAQIAGKAIRAWKDANSVDRLYDSWNKWSEE
jgi:hypothetical protein